MNDVVLNKLNIICHCSGTTQEKIKALIDNGITDLDSLSRRTGVCSGCGAYENLILQLIADWGAAHSIMLQGVIRDIMATRCDGCL